MGTFTRKQDGALKKNFLQELKQATVFILRERGEKESTETKGGTKALT